MDYWRIAAILGKRKWFILLSMFVTAGLTYGITKMMGSKWTATVQFVSPQSSQLTSGTDSGENSADTIQTAQTQAIIYSAIMKSQDVLMPTLKEVHLKQLPGNMLKTLDFTSTGPRLYQLQVTDTDKNRVQEIANSLAKNFVVVYHDFRSQQAQQTVKLLEDQLKEVDQKLNEARRSYDSYRNQHKIVGNLNSDLDAALSRLRSARQKQEETAQKLADAQARLMRTQSELAVPIPVVKSVSKPVENPVLKSKLDKMDQQISELRKEYTDEMPILHRARADREALAEQINQERILNQGVPVMPLIVTDKSALLMQAQNLKQEIAGLQAMYSAVNASQLHAQAELDQFKGIDSGMTNLTADVGALTETRSNLAMRLRNAGMLKDVTDSQTPIRIMGEVNEFNPPVNNSTNKMRLIIIGAICALLATSGAVIALENMDRRVRTVREAEIILPVPVLAAIPQPMGEVTFSSMARVTQLLPQSLQSEAFRYLGLHLLNQSENKARTLMICSAFAEQGTTSTLTNLGITLAQAGKKVILVDSNIRTAEMHKVFNIPNDFGYTNLLQRPDSLSVDRALLDTDIPNLQVICSGPQPANPWELFRSNTVQILADQLKSRADFVLYDTPSAILFTDALNLAPVVDAAFLCVRALQPMTGAEDRLVNLLKEANVPVLGCVLSDVPQEVVEGYANYQHYYRPAANSSTEEELKSIKAPKERSMHSANYGSHTIEIYKDENNKNILIS